jgi:predicted metal-dependent peptidase
MTADPATIHPAATDKSHVDITPVAVATLDTVKLSAARLWAAQRFPYFATGLFALFPVTTPGLRTFAVDTRWRLYVDPGVVTRWSVPQLGAVLVHELCHLLRDHEQRAVEVGVSDTQDVAWNIATDAEINDDLIAAGLSLPEDPVTPGNYGWPEAGLAETYFRLARQAASDSPCRTTRKPKKAKGTARAAARSAPPDPECGSGAHGRPRTWDLSDDSGIPTVGPEVAQLLRRQIAVDVTRHHRRAGGVPAGWLRWAEATLRSTVDWRRVLADEIRRGLHRAAGRADFSFARRSRRASVAGNIILPGTFRPSPDLALVLDTSGSMGPNQLAAALVEVDGILTRLGLAARRIPVLACDSEVGALSKVVRASDVVLAGGGGTDMGAGIAAAARLRPRPQVVVVLTDGYTPWPRSGPEGISVVVGLIGCHEPDEAVGVPAWARAVTIGDILGDEAGDAA